MMRKKKVGYACKDNRQFHLWNSPPSLFPSNQRFCLGQVQILDAIPKGRKYRVETVKTF